MSCSPQKINRRIDTINPCVYCRARRSVKEYPTYSIGQDHFSINRCLVCRTVFLTPSPTPEQLEQAYDDSYYGRGQAKFIGFIEMVLDYFRSARARKVSRYISPPAKILDIGCGNGRFLGNLIDKGYETCGIELPGKAAQRARKIPRLHLKIGRLSANDFHDKYFDAITMWHVFEHFSEPKSTLKIIQKIVKPGGYLIISMPNIESFQSRLFRGKWLALDPPKHLFFMGAADLASNIKGFGFDLIKLNYFSLEQNPFCIQQSILNYFLDDREVLFEALKGNNTYTRHYPPCSLILQKLFYIGSFPLFAFLATVESALGKGGTMELIFKKT